MGTNNVLVTMMNFKYTGFQYFYFPSLTNAGSDNNNKKMAAVGVKWS